jgi:hypothetical protein
MTWGPLIKIVTGIYPFDNLFKAKLNNIICTAVIVRVDFNIGQIVLLSKVQGFLIVNLAFTIISMQTDQKLDHMFVHVAGALEVAKPYLHSPIVATSCAVKTFGICDIKHYECGGLTPPELIVLSEELIGLGDIVHLNFDHRLPCAPPEVFVSDIHEVGVL